ncbi:hypothetical protein EU545_00945 [Candidatus Thorarchaeota archaeon]|nr:MAG: hypothetical protein EU545_00945 [Candidatus Thorarchaeota archaeon]
MSGDTALEKHMSVIEKNLGVTKKEAGVLLPIYAGGNMTVGALSVITGDALTSVKRTLSRLEKKGLVIEIEGIVPVYRALSPNLAVRESLATLVEEAGSLQDKAEDLVDKRLDQAEETTKTFLENRKSAVSGLKRELEAYEDEMVSTVQSQIEFVGGTADDVLSGFSERVESVLDSMGTTLEQDLGEQLSTLQTELDSIQAGMETAIEQINSEFSEVLQDDMTSASKNASKFKTKAIAMMDEARNIVEKAIADSQSAMQSVLEKMSTNMQSSIDETVSRTAESLDSVDGEVTQVLENLSDEVSNTHLTVKQSLNEIVDRNQEITEEYAGVVRSRIETVAESTDGFLAEVENWKNEVGENMSNSTQSITAQFEQIKATDAAYLEDIKNSLSGHLERLASMVSENHDELKSLVTEMQNGFGAHVADARAEVIGLLQKQNESEQVRIEEARVALVSNLDSWVTEGERDVNSNLKGVASDVNKTLTSQAEELTSLTKNMSSRVKSSFGTIQSSVKTKNETVLSGISRFVNDLESGFGETLQETVTEISSELQKKVKETKDLYETLNAQLDDRLAQSVSAISSQVDSVQKEVDSTITDQVQRIEGQADEIRGEFHLSLEEMTRQFIALTQSLESTFNGLIQSQTLEARDLISSAHTEFKNSIKSEMSSLHEDSLKLQQEYASEIGLRVDEIVESVGTMRKSLNDFSVEKQTQLSDRLANTHAMIESNLQAVEDNLDQIRQGTIKQMGESLVQTSREFETSVTGAKTNILDRVENTRETVRDAFARSSASIRSTVDNYAAEQTDAKQRLLADTNKKLDTLSTKLSNSSIESMESYHEQLVARENKIISVRRNVNDEISAVIEGRRDEAAEAFDAAAIWVENAFDNVSSSLDSLGTKLAGEIQLSRDNLIEVSEEVSENIIERGDSNVQQFETTTNNMLQKIDSLFKARLNEFRQATKTRLQTGKEAITNLSTRLSTTLDASVEDADTWTKQRKSEVFDSLKSNSEEYTDSVDSLTEDFTSLVERASTRLERDREDLFDKSREALLSANLAASRKFESLALDLKTKLSNDAYELIEEIRNEMGTKGVEMRDAATKANTQASSKTSDLTEKRNDLLNSFEADADKSAKNLLSSIRKDGKTLKQGIADSVNSMKELANNRMDALAAVQEASKSLLGLPSKETWYLSGTDEIHAHMVSMAERAKESVLLSVVDIDDLDVKKLSKVNAPRRKILVIPHSEEQPSALEKLTGWRIWETENPYELALCDTEELLLGGSTHDGRPIALVSSDPAYLRLYHDVLGPRLVESRHI